MFMLSVYAFVIAVGICLYWFLHSSPWKKSLTITEASLTSESKEPPEDGSSNSSSSSATNYFKGHKSPRKVQLKEVHHANETASVKVITHDGVTLVQTTSDKSNNHIYSKDNGKKAKEEKTKAHFKRRPAPPPPPKQPPKRPPPPPPPESPSPTPPTVVIMEDSNTEATSDMEKELQELRIDERRLDVSGGRRPDAMPSSSSSPQLLGSYGGEGECCSSPDLPLPPPPSSDNHGEVVVHDPLPPPPEVIDVELPSRTLDSSLVYPKNSYMSYRSEKKLGRQGFEGNYRRSFHSSASSMDLSTLGSGFQDGIKDALSPSTWEFVHNIRQHGTTVIFHSDALHSNTSQPQRSSSQELQSEDHMVNGIQAEIAKHTTSHDTTNSVPCPLTSQDTACESPSGEVTSLSTDSPMSPLESKINDSIVIQCDLSSEDVSSLENCLLTDDSFVDSMESDTSSLISVDQNQNAVDIKCDRTIPAIVSNNNNINNNNNNNNDLVVRTNSSTQTTDTPRLRRKCSKTKEELECERLSVTFLHHFGDYRLKNLLVPASNHKTMSDYMDGLLNFELEKCEVSLQRSPVAQESERKQNGHREDNIIASEKANDSLDFKVKQLNHYMDIIENQNVGGELELKKLRDELITSIKKKVEVMRAEQVIIREEIQRNEKLGKDLANRVQKVAKPNEVEKYILHVEETEKIVNLLLSLSGRLAKAENMLGSIPKDASPEEKRIVEAKRDKLLEQHEDARRLKESIDRRSNHISAFLQKYLSEEEYADYDYFIKMKTKLIVDTREMDEKINLGEEQLVALRNSIDAHLWKSANS